MEKIAKLIKLLTLLAFALNLSGCFTFAAMTATKAVADAFPPSEEEKLRIQKKFFGKHKPSETNSAIIRKLLAGKTVSVGDFDTPETRISQLSCRLIFHVGPPLGYTFGSYIRSSLISELDLAGAYNDISNVKLTGKLKDASFSLGSWNFELEVASSNGKVINVSTEYPIDTPIFGFAGGKGCERTQDAFSPAIEDLMTKLINSPHFEELLK